MNAVGPLVGQNTVWKNTAEFEEVFCRLFLQATPLGNQNISSPDSDSFPGHNGIIKT